MLLSFDFLSYEAMNNQKQTNQTKRKTQNIAYGDFLIWSLKISFANGSLNLGFVHYGLFDQNNSVKSLVSELVPWTTAISRRTLPSMTRISENELHPSKSALCKNTSSRYEQTISTEKIMISETISIPNVRKMRTVDRLHFRFLTNAYLFFSFLSLSKFSTSIGCNF